MSVVRCWRNGQAVVHETRRACLYGDGLFETMRCYQGRLVFWSDHWQRLQMGLDRLGYPMVTESMVLEALAPALTSMSTDAVIRLSVSRGGVRGYRAQAEADVIYDVQASAMPKDVWHGRAIRARWCQTTWAQQPLLAGIKHLNRLEQVLARSEWTDARIEEGLVCDTAGHVISGTMSALLLRVGQIVLAADIRQTGIDSIARKWVLAQLPALGYQCQVQSLSRQDVLAADELLFMNVVQGIGSVAELDGQAMFDHTLSAQLAPRWSSWQQVD